MGGAGWVGGGGVGGGGGGRGGWGGWNSSDCSAVPCKMLWPLLTRNTIVFCWLQHHRCLLRELLCSKHQSSSDGSTLTGLQQMFVTKG